MRKFRIISAALFVFLFGRAISAQEPTAVSLGAGRVVLKVSLNPFQPLDRNQQVLLKNIDNYSLYEIESPDDPALMRGIQKNIFAAPPTCDFDCARISLPLKAPLDYGKTYMLKIAGLTLDKKSVRPIRFEVKNEAAIVPSLDESRGEVRVQAGVPLEEDNKFLTVKETVLKVSEKGDKAIAVVKVSAAEVIDSSATNELTLRLERKLAEASTHFLSIENDLTDGRATPITAAGKIKIAGLPAPPNAPPVDVKISTSAAVNQKPLFDLVANIGLPKPWNTDGMGKWYLEPKISIDLGLGQTKSNNSIIFNIPLKRDLSIAGSESGERISELDAQKGEIAKLPIYYGWRRTPRYRLNSIEFRSGPKFEVDRRFARVNILESTRLDFLFSRWLASIADRRARLREDLGKERSEQVFMRYGFRLLPYFNFDFGGKVTNEVVENTKKQVRVIIPRNLIIRTQFGFVNVFQWYLLSFPMSLTIDENLSYLWKTETIGSVTTEGIDLRKIRGFQHRAKASFDIFLDPAKRYSFNISYENGRAAPNFEYLNKITTGFRLQY
jgi:hypothetical protein